MPVYLFTYHAYGSWMPDHKRGYTRKEEGVLPADQEMASNYRSNQGQSSVVFDTQLQQALIEEVQVAASFQRFVTYMIATDPSHLHVLCGWNDERQWDKLRNGIRESITRMLNRSVKRRKWLTENASRKQVLDETHFNHLRENYLSDHRGLKWRPDRGNYK